MKKILAIVIALLMTVSVADAVIYDWSATGWWSTHGDSLAGIALNVRPLGNGYNIDCWGGAGVCYQINGQHLSIFDSFGDPGGIGVGIYRN